MLEGQVADLVDDDQPVAPQPSQLGGEPSGAMSVGEPGDPLGRGREQHPMPVVGGGDAQTGGQVGLPGARRAEQHDVASFVQETTRCEGCDLLTDGGLGVPVELLDRLDRTEPGGPDPQLGTGCVACCDLTIQDGGEVLLVRPAGVTSMVGQSAGCFGDPGRLQR